MADRTNVTLAAALAEAEQRYIKANPNSHTLYEKATAVMPGGNTRSVLHYDPFPLTFERAQGARVWDADKHELLDFLGEYTAGLYGHSDPIISQAIETALHDGIVLGGPNRQEAEFAKVICDRFPAIERVRFCNSGTEANLYALSATRAFTAREDIIVMQMGYHGGVFYFAGDCPLNVPFPFHKIPYNDTEQAVAKIREVDDRLAAVIVEPMLGGGGCIPASAEFLNALRQETEAVGAMLVFDEVMTSRLAPGGLHEQHAIRPDLVTLGKYVGGGMTFGAFGGRTDLMDRFDPRNPQAWPHAGTFNNNVLTIAAGLAGLTQVYTADAVEALNSKGDMLRAELRARIEQRALPVQITGLGSMTAIHFSHHPVIAPADLPTVPEALKALFHLDMIDQGCYLARRGMVNLSLPLTSEDIQTFVDAFDEVLATRATVIEAAIS